jgi:25S rRNA (cytosine2278-C5)-methyltransferase
MILHAMACEPAHSRLIVKVYLIIVLNKVPSVKRIVYSTCSVHATENELVVQDAVRSDLACELGFKLANRNEMIPSWQRRGLPEHLGLEGGLLNGNFAKSFTFVAESVIRCSPGEDRTNGFFVAMFVRDTEIFSHRMPVTEGNNKRKGSEELQQRRKKRRKSKREK